MKIYNNTFEDLFENHYRTAVFIVQRIVNCQDAAEDIVQDVFVKLLDTDLDKITNPSAYLFRSVRNASIDYLRKKSNIRLEQDVNQQLSDLTDDNLTLEIEYAQRIQKLHDSIEQLPKGTRRVLELICFENLTYKEVSEHLEISLSTVKTHMYRAYNLLRTHMGTK